MIDAIRQEVSALSHPAPNAPPAWYRKRGKTLERIIHDVLKLENLDSKTSYRPEGEEIDGSFVLDGRFFLLEAKWYSDPLPASYIYAFKGKVDGKLIGTIGVFLSMSGYSEQAAEALRRGKDINIILFDKNDFEACLSNQHSFSKVLKRKLRVAAEVGELYYPYSADLAIESLSDLIFVVEGPNDIIILSTLANRVLIKYNITRKINFVTAMGKKGISDIANAISSSSISKSKVILVADSDGNISETRDILTHNSHSLANDILIVDPDLEVWLFPQENNPKRYTYNLIKGDRSKLEQIALNVDIDQLQSTSIVFQEFMKLLTK
jgi:hypothetical protein